MYYQVSQHDRSERPYQVKQSEIFFPVQGVGRGGGAFTEVPCQTIFIGTHNALTLCRFIKLQNVDMSRCVELPIMSYSLLDTRLTG